MTDWVATTCSVVAAVVAVGGLALSKASSERAERQAAAERGKLEERVGAQERWQQSRSVDRSELEALDHRVSCVETDVRDMSKQLAEVAKQGAVAVARLEGLENLIKAQGTGIDHQIRGVRQVLENMVQGRGRVSA